MTTDEFSRVLQNRINRINHVLGVKAKEYANPHNRYHNFDRGATALNITPEQYCVHLAMKHLISIMDMVDDIGSIDRCADAAVWDEKIGDAINYLILLEGLVLRRIHTTFDRQVQNQPPIVEGGLR
jgi:hypothetical protein